MPSYKGFTSSCYGDLVVCVIITILGYFALFVPPDQAANLPSVPDEGQYAIGASNLFNKGTYSITLNHQDYPSYYPYGFSLLLAPALYLWGPFVGNVTYANFSLNIAVLILSYLLGRIIGGWIVGCITALFLLGNHLFLHFSHRILAQGATAAFTILATVLLVKIQEKQGKFLPLRLLGILAVVAGYLSTIHASWICLNSAVVISLGFIYQTNWRKLSGALLLLGGIVASFLAVQLVYNQRIFGESLKNGYNYWHEASLSQFFSLEWFLSFNFNFLYQSLRHLSLTKLRWFFDSSNLTHYVSGFLGLHEFSVLYSPLATIFIYFGTKEILRNHYGRKGQILAIFTFSSLIFLLILFIPYHYQALRFFIPMLPLVGVFVSIGIISAIKNHCQWSKHRLKTFLILFCISLFFCDLFYRYLHTGIYYVQKDLSKLTGRSRMARYACAKAYNSLVEETALIVSSIDINYISHFVLSETDRRYLPLVRNIMYVSRDPQIPTKNWRSLGLPVMSESPEDLAFLLRAGTPVYTDDLGEHDFQEEYLALRSAFEWQTVGSCESFHIYRLHLRPHSSS
jgi:hypothetical protein